MPATRSSRTASRPDPLSTGGSGGSRTFRSLRHRNYRLYWIGQLVSNTGNWLTNLALVLLVLKLTDSGLAIGLLSGCQYGPILLLSASAGVLADRMSKRKILLITQTLEMLQSVALGVLAFLPHPPLAGFYIIATVGGVLLALDSIVRKAIIRELVPPTELSNAVVLYTAVNTTSQILGPALAGVLVYTVGFAWCFLLDATSYLVVLAVLAMMRAAELIPMSVVARGRGQLREGLRYVRREPTMRVVFVIMLITAMFIYRWNTTLPLLAKRSLGASDFQFTVLFVTFSFGALTGALLSARFSRHTLRATLLSTFALAAALAFLAAAPNLATAFPAVYLTGITCTYSLTVIYAIVQINVDQSVQGRVLALQSTVMLGTTPFGAVFLGYAADAFGARSPIVIGSASAVVAGLVGLYMCRRSGLLAGRGKRRALVGEPLPAGAHHDRAGVEARPG